MINDTERREVARRLREVQSDVIPGTKTEVHPIAGRIIGGGMRFVRMVDRDRAKGYAQRIREACGVRDA